MDEETDLLYAIGDLVGNARGGLNDITLGQDVRLGTLIEIHKRLDDAFDKVMQLLRIHAADSFDSKPFEKEGIDEQTVYQLGDATLRVRDTMR